MDRHCTDRSVRGFGGAAGAIGKQIALYASGSLSGCCKCVVCRSIDRSAWREAPRTSMMCHASEPKHETYCDVRPGSVFAL